MVDKWDRVSALIVYDLIFLRPKDLCKLTGKVLIVDMQGVTHSGKDCRFAKLA